MDSRDNQNEIYSKVVRAGRRTYFFDVKLTKAGEPFLNITESIKSFDEEEGKFSFRKHRLFLYKEDFDAFEDGLMDALDFARSQISEDNESGKTVAEEEE